MMISIKERVTFVLDGVAKNAVIEYVPMNEQLIKAKFMTWHTKVSIILWSQGHQALITTLISEQELE